MSPVAGLLSGRFDGAVALVTGGGQGIGLAIAQRLALEGAAVAVLGRTEAVLTSAVAELSAGGHRALAVVGDVSVQPDVERAVSATLRAFGRLDILCNNAAVESLQTLDDCTESDFDRTMAVNLRGAMMLSQAAASHLEATSGSIVNISSIMAAYAEPGYAAYCASKAGMVAMTRVLAQELGPRGVRVNVVCPGYIDTALWDRALAELPDPGGFADRVAAAHPVRRRGLPGDVAGAVAFLASRDAAFITGASLVVDGGLTTQLGAPLSPEID